MPYLPIYTGTFLPNCIYNFIHMAAVKLGIGYHTIKDRHQSSSKDVPLIHQLETVTLYKGNITYLKVL